MKKFTLITLLFFSSQLSANQLSGKEFLQICSGQHAGYGEEFCMGYILATIDMVKMSQPSDGKKLYCLPNDHESIRDLTINWFKQNPEYLQNEASWSIVFSLESNFSC